MSGYRTYQRMQDLQQQCDKLGFLLDGTDRHGLGLHGHGDRDIFFLRVPLDNGTSLPIYTRGIVLFAGDLPECECFVRGWERHQEYTTGLGLNNKIATAERRTADHYRGERIKRAIMEGRDPGYSGVLPDNEINAAY